jgi:hypothetical protein
MEEVMANRKNKIDDIWKHIQKTESCWLWQGRLDRDGYGWWWFEGKNVRPHRIMAEYFGTPIRPPMISRHTCHVRNCVNPEHIIPGTQQENVMDQVRIGTHHKLKFSNDAIAKIRQDYSTGNFTQVELGKKYGMSSSQANAIVNNKTRKLDYA